MRAKRPTPPGRVGRLLFGGLLVLGLTAVGCRSGDPMPKTYKVTGSVTFTGGKPMAGGGIRFTPVGDSTFVVTGDVHDDGTFNLDTVKGNDRASGAPEGEYRVTVLPPIPADQRTLPPIELSKTYRVEAKDNQFPIEVTPPRKKS